MSLQQLPICSVREPLVSSNNFFTSLRIHNLHNYYVYFFLHIALVKTLDLYFIELSFF